MKPHTFVNDKYFSYANAEVSDEPTGGTRMPPIVYGETDILTISPTRPNRGILGGIKPSVRGTRATFLSNVRSGGTTDALLGTKPRFKPKTKADGFLFIKKNKRLSEYRGLWKRLRDLIEKSKTSLGGKSDLIEAEIVNVQNKIATMDNANMKLIASGSSMAIPNEVIQAVMINPNATDEEVAKVIETSAENQMGAGVTTTDVTTTSEAPNEGKKMNLLLPLLGVGVVLYFVFRK